MEKVIRICDITGRITTVAERVTTDEAMRLVRRLSKEDEFAVYYRITL